MTFLRRKLLIAISLVLGLFPSTGFSQRGCPRRPVSEQPQKRQLRETASGRVRVAKLILSGQTGLAPDEEAEIVRNFQGWRGPYEKRWEEEFAARLQYPWQQRGYFKAEIHVDAQLITEDSAERIFTVTAQIDSGRQYHLGDIAFAGGTQFPAEQARKFFTLSSGELFDIGKIHSGLDSLRRAYGTRGFIEFSSVPNVSYDEVHGLINVTIELEEGRQFRISHAYFFGLDQEQAKTLLANSGLVPGAVADPEKVDDFVRKYDVDADRFIDEGNAMVCYEFSFFQRLRPD